MRNLVLVALLFLAVACGVYRFPGATPSSGVGTVSGHVIARPCTPVEPGGGACPISSLSGIELDFSSSGKSAAAVTDSQGAYSIDLAAGTWKVALKTYMRIVSGPTLVSVAAGSHVVADYVLDTGIRFPVPQQ